MKYFYFLLFSIIGFTATAQNYVDVAKFHYANTPVNQFDSTTNGTRVQEFGLDFTYPIKLESGHAILTGFYAENISTQTSPENSNLTSVGTILLKAGINFVHNEKVSTTVLFLPKISSDFKDWGAKDFQYGALALAKIKKNENFLYQAGLYLSLIHI